MRLVRLFFALAILAILAAGGWLYWFATQPRPLAKAPLDFTVKTGSGWKALSRQLADEGLLADPYTFWAIAQLRGLPPLHAGTSRVERPLTGVELFDKLARGDVMLAELRFIEGTTLRQWLAQLAKEGKVRGTLAGKKEADVRAALGIAEAHPEGWLFPDT